jgi:acyl-CoA synthetase (AMP-forming)/AMP-acid ligase II
LSEAQVAFTCALSWAGITVVPLNARLSHAELVAIVRDAAVSAFAFDAGTHERVTAIAAEAPAGLLIDLDAPPRADAAQMHVSADDALAAILYTGGTTGTPKGVMISTGALVIQGALMRDALALDSDVVFLHAMPIFHIAGCDQLYAAIGGGAVNVFRPGLDPAGIYEEIRLRGVTVFCGAPTLIAMVLSSPSRDDALLERVTTFGYGAAPISETLLTQALAAMPNAKFRQYYGLTETAGPVLSVPPEYHVTSGPKAGKLQSAGLPVPNATVRIVDADENDVPAGSAGELFVHSNSLTSGYWRDPAKTAQLFSGPWLRTGDIGVMDADGFVTIVDRSKDIIVSGGENVYSIEVENAIAAHPDVESCAVIGIPDPLWGEAVHAVVVPRAGRSLTAEAIVAHCRTQIAGYKCPKSVAFRSGALPLSGVGKVLKHILRAEAVAALERSERRSEHAGKS